MTYNSTQPTERLQKYPIISLYYLKIKIHLFNIYIDVYPLLPLTKPEIHMIMSKSRISNNVRSAGNSLSAILTTQDLQTLLVTTTPLTRVSTHNSDSIGLNLKLCFFAKLEDMKE